MGVVYACLDTIVGDRVAVKLLHTADGTPMPGTAAWFWAEARALASLDHPGIVRGRDFGVLMNKAPYLAMDLAPGISLTDLLMKTDLSWPGIWLLVDQTLAALGHAHARGIIHGDLKHSNIMVQVRPDNVLIQLLDFGLAWLLRDRFDHRIDGTAREGPMVRPHAGTVGWMAPEQIRGAVPHVGPATDLYALGCILFQLLTGNEPYESDDLNEVQRMHRSAPVPEVPLPREVPHGVAAFVQRLLAKRPWQRFDFAADARLVWASFRPESPVSTWELPDPDVCDEAITLRPPTPAASSVSLPFEIPASNATPPGLLSFGPGRFVAREAERRMLREVCQQMVSAPMGTSRMVLLTGRAGVGKSHLAEWLCEDAHEQAIALPLRARHNRIPTPVDGIVGAVLGHLGLENADRTVIERVLLNIWEVQKDDDDGQQWVAAVAEWLRPTTAGQQDAVGPTGKRFVINTDEIRWVVMRYALERIGAHRPLLIWLDDLHLAAHRDFFWIDRLRTEAPRTRMLLVATMATDGPDPEPLQRVRQLAQRFGATELSIEPMNQAETAQLLTSSAMLGDDVVSTAFERSRGIPLFALQLLHAWANGGSLELREGRYHVKQEAAGAVPATTAALWEERIAALPSDAQQAAMVASALGGDVRSDVLAPLLVSLGIRALDAMTALEQYQVLVRQDANRYRWPHTLLQEHLLSRLSTTDEASRVFREAAFALASYHPAAGNRRIVRHRVMLLIRAREVNEAVRVMIDYVSRGWERTRDVNATLEDLAMIEGLARGAWAAMHSRWRAEALRHSGQLDEAATLAHSARRAFEALHDVFNEAQCMRLLGHVASDKGAPRDGRVLVSEARRMMSALGDEWGLAQCDVVLGELDYLLGAHDQAEQELKQALAPLERAQDILRQGQCHILIALIQQARNDCDGSRQHLFEARRGFDRIGYRLGTAQCDVALAHADHRAGELEAARARAQNALSAFRMLGTPRGQSAALRVMAMASLDAGELNEAERCANETLRVFEQMGDPWGLVEARLLLAQVALARGHLDDAQAWLSHCDVESLQEREPKQHWHLTQSWLAFRQGRHAEALAHLQAAKDALGDNRLGDHAPYLFTRLSAMPWPADMRPQVDEAIPVAPLTINA